MDERPSGIELATVFWSTCVRPVVEDLDAGAVAAALLGFGSEVLGFDDDRSPDHNFGPRLQLFLPGDPDPVATARVVAALDEALPDELLGFPVRFPLTTDPETRHRVQVTTVSRFFSAVCGVDPTEGDVPVTAWLRMPTQALASVTAGVVLADPLGDLATARDALAWYPTDLWRYVLGCQWRRLAQEEAFIGRTGEVGDEVGSRVIAARLARDLVRLAFLVERRWAPYAKWIGTAFAQLPVAADAIPKLEALTAATTWSDRQVAYAEAAAVLAERFNDLGLVPPIDPTPRPYFDRPFVVLDADRFAEACLAGSPLRSRGWRGAVDQWTDNTDALGDLGALAAGDDRDDDLGLADRLRRPVVVVPYRRAWPDEFGAAAREISGALGDLVVRIDHIGSTSVPGLPAKDVLDIQVVVASLQPEEPIVDAFATLGFRASPEPWNRRDTVPPGWTGPASAWDKLVFAPTGDDHRAVNVHVRVDGGPNVRRPLLFRDYLRARPEARDEWGRFKVELAARVRHLAAYGQVKQPATELLFAGAERWATDTGWSPPSPSGPVDPG